MPCCHLAILTPFRGISEDRPLKRGLSSEPMIIMLPWWAYLSLVILLLGMGYLWGTLDEFDRNR